MTGHLINYFVFAEGSLNDASLEFDKLVNFLSSQSEFRVKIEDNEASIFSLESGETSFLSFKTQENKKDATLKNQIIYSIKQNDWASAKSLNKAIKNYGYRLFNPSLGFFLVNNENLTDLSAILLDEKTKEIFNQFDLVPLFKYENSLVYYAEDKTDKSIHLINRHLMEFLISENKAIARKKNFSIKVADDIPHFIALFDRGLIPISFYSTQSDKNHIINLSGINLEKTEEKIIVTPIFFEFVSARQSFKNSQRIPFMKENTIAKGGSLKDYLEAMNEGSFFRGKILCVKVGQDIAFELDKNKNPVPRITISIFLDEQND
ncbi:MAG: hypothetical protein ACPLYF_04320 [Fervidobacterium sp.]